MRGKRTRQAPVWKRGSLWRAVRNMLALLFVVLCVPSIIGLIGVGFRCGVFAGTPSEPDTPAAVGQEPAAFTQAIARQADARRPEDQTYLTFPEWYIVYSADEYAAFIADHPPSRFPYFRSIGQFWSSYYDVCAVTRQQYQFNAGYHLSLVVIGSSFTVENTLRGIYENTVGRVTEWISHGGATDEDAYARIVARDYGAFIHTVPWYEFPFGPKLSGLWSTTPAIGPNLIRKWERRFALSVEYGAKAAYGGLIRQGTQSVYATEDLTILAWIRADERQLVNQPDVAILARAGQDLLVSLPRYEAFTQLVPRLAEGVEFVQIAGNDEILVTLITPREWDYNGSDGTLLFSTPILTEPTQKRVALNAPVAALSALLRTLSDSDVELEHLYDY
jgi:hypothetical protein